MYRLSPHSSTRAPAVTKRCGPHGSAAWVIAWATPKAHIGLHQSFGGLFAKDYPGTEHHTRSQRIQIIAKGSNRSEHRGRQMPRWRPMPLPKHRLTSYPAVRGSKTCGEHAQSVNSRPPVSGRKKSANKTYMFSATWFREIALDVSTPMAALCQLPSPPRIRS